MAARTAPFLMYPGLATMDCHRHPAKPCFSFMSFHCNCDQNRFAGTLSVHASPACSLCQHGTCAYLPSPNATDAARGLICTCHASSEVQNTLPPRLFSSWVVPVFCSAVIQGCFLVLPLHELLLGSCNVSTLCSLAGGMAQTAGASQ